MMGLGMSRSLGDLLAHEVGVTEEPQIFHYTIDFKADKFIIVGTDGIWDVVDNMEAVQFVHGFICRSVIANGFEEWDANGAAKMLGQIARRRWQQSSAIVDDITCLVVKLKFSVNS
mmetsp:Transcript_15440/g.22758  ORF Transcript_15440/g.22758 Transcript_15440/m.22758 type:complete len:116 (+) Transcript_15440:738-1085(+)